MSSNRTQADSIFGLEPSTVRVREVGVGRERRARSHTATTASTASPPSRPVNRTNESQSGDALVSADITTQTLPTPPLTPPNNETLATPPLLPLRKPSPIPYSTFQQLDSILPNLPSAILSSSWVIPPLYVDVISAGARSMNPDGELGPPLLSPVSLLNSRDGPPALFFVTRGNYLTGIVSSDGKSILKRPIVFNSETTGGMECLPYSRIEVILVEGGTKTTIIGIGKNEIKAVLIGGSSASLPAPPLDSFFGEAIEVVTDASFRGAEGIKEIQSLGAVNNQFFFSEKVGNYHSIHCLSSVM